MLAKSPYQKRGDRIAMDSVNCGSDDAEISEEKQPLEGHQIAMDSVNSGYDDAEISEEKQPLEAVASTGCDDTHENSSDEWVTIFTRWDKNEYDTTAELSDIFTLPAQKVREVFLGGQPSHQPVNLGEVDAVSGISWTQHVIKWKLEGSGDTSLNLCARAGHVKAMEILIKVAKCAEKDVNMDVQNSDGDTPLYLAVREAVREDVREAVREGHRKVVEKLLAAGSDVNTQNHSGENALMMASRNGDDAIVMKLLERPEVDVNLSTTSKYKKPKAGVNRSTTRKYKRPEVDVNLSAYRKRDLDSAHPFGKTALHLCAQKGHVKIVELLTKVVPQKEDPEYPETLLARNVQDEDGNTALHLAVLGGHTEVVKKLITHLYRFDLKEVTATGTDVDQNREDGQEGHSKGIRKLLESFKPGSDGDTKRSKNDLVAVGANVNIKNNNGETALMMALTNVQENIIGMLLAAQEVDVNLKNSKSKTALHIAAEKCEVKIVDMLLKKPNLDAQLRDDEFGETPLHIAARLGKDAVVTKLISHAGFNLFKDKEGKTPLQCALDLQYDTIVRSMKDHIAMLYRDRQVYVDATNAILVGAALIASVTFASWSQPPLGYTTFYGEQYSTPDPASPTNPMYVAFEHHKMMEFFWVFNSLSFFSAIASVIMGARSVLPSYAQELTINQEVKRLRDGLLATGCMLTVSMAFVLAAFAMAGLVLLPPLPGLQARSIAIMGVGGGLCLLFLYLLSRKIWIELCTP